MKNHKPLLSICIPTFNRAEVLSGALNALYKQTFQKKLPLEILISDNCSTDKTETVVNTYVSKGLCLKYIKNTNNIGMDRNFAQCFRLAAGKYVLVLGDDDYLIEGMLEKLLFLLEGHEYGVVHLNVNSKNNNSPVKYNKSDDFLKDVSFWVTYISSNVVNAKYIRGHDFEKNFGTYLAITNLYISAVIKAPNNLMVNERVFLNGIATRTNGGYDFFKVFIANYLDVWKDLYFSGSINLSLYKYIKRDIFKKFIVENIYRILIKKETNNYRNEKSWQLIFKYYGLNMYFYFYLLRFLLFSLLRFLFSSKNVVHV